MTGTHRCREALKPQSDVPHCAYDGFRQDKPLFEILGRKQGYQLAAMQLPFAERLVGTEHSD